MKNQETTFKLLALTSILAILISILSMSIPVSAQAKSSKSTLQKSVDAMQPGWNLGNTFDAAGDETSWGNPRTTKELIDQIAVSGFKSIRIPITWNHRMDVSPDYRIDPDFMKRIQEVVDWSLNDGLYVIINLHHDSNWIMNMESDHDNVLNKFNKTWKQISDHFKGYPDKLLFESINEPRFSDDWGKDTPTYFEMVDDLNTSFVKIVRKSGGHNARRPLVLPTLTCGTAQTRMDELAKTMSKLHDPNLIATIHYYGYYPFSVNLGGATTFNDDARNDLVQTFDRAHDTFVAKGIPVIVGEYGLLGFDSSLDTIEHGEVLKFLEYINGYAKQKELSVVLWDNGQHFDRRAFKWQDESLYDVIKASWNGRSSTAQTDQIFMKKGGEIRDVSIQMNLNGNTLVEIQNGVRTLTKGTDYELNQDMLTLKSGFLQTLVSDEYGVQATLTFNFSAGADWKIDTIAYDTPRLKSAKGTILDFAIPTDFNGDRLATMEAYYKKGGNAGPDDWTPFKQFNSSFYPRYDAKAIILKKHFFDNLKDGDVVLKLQFWSGQVIEYTISKDLTEVVGVSSQDPSEAKNDTADQNQKQDPNNSEQAATAVTAFPAVADPGAKPADSQSTSPYVITGICMLILIAGFGIFLMKKNNAASKK